MRFRRKVDVFLPTNVIGLLVEINVVPCREGDFLVAATGAEEEFVPNLFLVIHGCEQFRQLIGGGGIRTPVRVFSP